MSLQGPGMEGTAMSHHAHKVEFGPLGGKPQGERWLGCLGEGVSSPYLEVVSWRPIFKGFWGQGGVIDAGED